MDPHGTRRMKRALAAAGCALAALPGAPASAQFKLRPTAKAEFRIEALDYKAAGVDEPMIAELIEDELFPRTFLRATPSDEKPTYTLRVTLKEKTNESVHFPPAYLYFDLAGPFVWQPEHGSSFVWAFRDAQQAAAQISKLTIERELRARIGELSANANALIRGLLCYVPIAQDELGPRSLWFFDDVEEREAQMRLPFRREEVGLLPDSEFLLYVKYKDRRYFHLVCADDERAFDPGPTLPPYFRDGVVGRDRLVVPAEATFDAEDSEALARATAETFRDRVPRAKLKPLAVHRDVEPGDHLVESLGIFVAHSVPMRPEDAPTPPSEVQ